MLPEEKTAQVFWTILCFVASASKYLALIPDEGPFSARNVEYICLYRLGSE